MPDSLNRKNEEIIDISFGKNWDYIPLTKEYIENCLEIDSKFDKRSISKIILSASELMENAVKYSDEEGVRVILERKKGFSEVKLLVYNFLDEEKANRLIEEIKEMNAADALEYYIGKMRDQNVDEDMHKKSGLGFARINYEAEASIDARYIKSEKVMEITAVFKI